MVKAIIAIGCLCVVFAAAPVSADDRGDRREGYWDYRGYKERPYDRRRHYQYHQHRDHRYKYKGHWRSWDEWDHYARKHPHVRKHGRYYHDGAHLMFRTCDPDSNTCIFFSIGR